MENSKLASHIHKIIVLKIRLSAITETNMGDFFFGLTRTFQNLAYERLPHLIHNFPESFTMFQRHENPNLTLFVDWIGETYNFRER